MSEVTMMYNRPTTNDLFEAMEVNVVQLIIAENIFLTLIKTNSYLIERVFGIKGSFKNIGNLTYLFTPLDHLIKENKIEKKDFGNDTEDYLNSGLPGK